MRLGVIIHGPEAIDTGRAVDLLSFLGRRGELEACLGGAMGAIAVIDAGLEDLVDISRREKVSEAMIRLDRTCDLVVILNHCKYRESGVAFGSILRRRTQGVLRKPVIQIDDGFVMPLNDEGRANAEGLALELGMKLESPIIDDFPQDVRSLHGVEPGESIWINGNVIGRAVSSQISIRIGDDGLPLFSGIDVKDHGLEKVIPFDLERAMIRTGSVRRTLSTPKSRDNGGNGSVMIIDHSAEDSFFETNGASLAITVGDDTTRIAGALLYRKGIPVIGIVDGDEDGICRETVFAPGSVIIMLEPGIDDLLGHEVRTRFFNGEKYAKLRGTSSDLADAIIEMGGDRIREVFRFDGPPT